MIGGDVKQKKKKSRGNSIIGALLSLILDPLAVYCHNFCNKQVNVSSETRSIYDSKSRCSSKFSQFNDYAIVQGLKVSEVQRMAF